MKANKALQRTAAPLCSRTVLYLTYTSTDLVGRGSRPVFGRFLPSFPWLIKFGDGSVPQAPFGLAAQAVSPRLKTSKLREFCLKKVLQGLLNNC
jgi:hypothetical protein